jgi:hypothetical protein
MAIRNILGSGRLSRLNKSVPDTIIQDSIWANTLYPQQMTAINFMVGAAATNIALSGERSWQNIMNARITNEQTDQIIERMHEMHRVFKPPAEFNVTQRQLAVIEKSGVFHFGPKLLQATVYNALANANRLNKYFVYDMLPHSPQPKKAIKQLFTPGANGQPRAEGVALNGIWSAAAESLKSAPARAISHAYRPLLIPPTEGVLSTTERIDRVGKIAQSVASLHDIIIDHVEEKIPEIVDTSGIVIQPGQASHLISALFDTVSTRWMNPDRLAAQRNQQTL